MYRHIIYNRRFKSVELFVLNTILTVHSPIAIELSQNLQVWYLPIDLLLVQSVVVFAEGDTISL